MIAVCTCGQERRSQEPVPPFPYQVEEVRIENDLDGAILSGTLTIPEHGNNFPAVVLVSGSGLQDRDESVYGHKPFKVLADFLTRKGIAVLRYDDRGAGKSKGNLIGATTETFAGDTYAAVKYLFAHKKINSGKVGIIGHSEGGLICTILAAKHPEIAFVVMLAGPGVPIDHALITANEKKLRSQGKNEAIVNAGTELFELIFKEIKIKKDHQTKKQILSKIIRNWQASLTGDAKKDIDEFIAENPDFFEYMADEWATPWFEFAANYDPRINLRQIKSPVLALNGDKDCQVLAEINLPEIEKAMKEGGNKNFRIEYLKNINHLFQKCETGFRDEYSLIEETFNEDVMTLITDWIKEQTKE